MFPITLGPITLGPITLGPCNLSDAWLSLFVRKIRQISTRPHQKTTEILFCQNGDHASAIYSGKPVPPWFCWGQLISLGFRICRRRVDSQLAPADLYLPRTVDVVICRLVFLGGLVNRQFSERRRLAYAAW